MVRPILSALTLVVALGAPVLVPAVALAGEQPRVSVRIYDRSHKDYHPWSGDEDRAYRGYLVERHRSYRPISRTTRRQQAAYWQWRHQH
jgi:hypothetical protein